MTWDWESVWSVLRWVLITLAVGFIGQFGRSLALAILRKRRAAQEQEKEKGSVPLDAVIEQARRDGRVKIEKKRAKSELKREKKTAKTDSDAD